MFWENHFSQTAANSIRGWLYGERAERIQASYIWKCPKSHDSNSRSNGRDRAYFCQRRVEHQGNTMLWEITCKREGFLVALSGKRRQVRGEYKERAKHARRNANFIMTLFAWKCKKNDTFSESNIRDAGALFVNAPSS